ncbi:MAG: AarF/UbiB family protein, partial [Bacteroidales bacterium]|nr:AarF/UbiB family protein [Bacteroidales bacterium]
MIVDKDGDIKIPKLKRYREIGTILIKYGFEDIIYSDRRFIRFLRNLITKKKTNPLLTGRWVRVREMLEELGPTFVKFGQIMSNRPDLLPGDLILELRKLQEAVPPFPGEQAKKIIERELGKSTDKLFTKFDIKPLASASIAQVHRATLKNGDKVVLKVMRPGIRSIMKTDIRIMYSLARLAENQFRKIRLLTPTEFVEEFEKA